MHTPKPIHAICLLLILILTACVPYSDHPLTPLAKAVEDPALIGDWYVDENDKRTFFHILRGEKAGDIRIRIEEENETEPGEFSILSGHLGKLAGERYMNLLSNDPKDDIPGFMFVRYRIEDGKLGISLSDPSRLEQAIKSKALEGELIKSKWFTTAHITAGTRQLQRFMAENQADVFMEIRYLQRLESKRPEAKTE